MSQQSVDKIYLELRESQEHANCTKCRGSGFSGYGSGYGDVCDECGGQSPAGYDIFRSLSIQYMPMILDALDARDADVAALRESLSGLLRWTGDKEDVLPIEDARKTLATTNPGRGLLDAVAKLRHIARTNQDEYVVADKAANELQEQVVDTLAAKNARLRERLEAAEAALDPIPIAAMIVGGPPYSVTFSERAFNALAKYAVKEKADA